MNDEGNLNNKCKSRDNKSVNSYGSLLKRMLYCPGSGQELLSTREVSLWYAMLPMFSGSESAFVNN